MHDHLIYGPLCNLRVCDILRCTSEQIVWMEVFGTPMAVLRGNHEELYTQSNVTKLQIYLAE